MLLLPRLYIADRNPYTRWHRCQQTVVLISNITQTAIAVEDNNLSPKKVVLTKKKQGVILFPLLFFCFV